MLFDSKMIYRAAEFSSPGSNEENLNYSRYAILKLAMASSFEKALERCCDAETCL